MDTSLVTAVAHDTSKDRELVGKSEHAAPANLKPSITEIAFRRSVHRRTFPRRLDPAGEFLDPARFRGPLRIRSTGKDAKANRDWAIGRWLTQLMVTALFFTQ